MSIATSIDDTLIVKVFDTLADTVFKNKLLISYVACLNFPALILIDYINYAFCRY